MGIEEIIQPLKVKCIWQIIEAIQAQDALRVTGVNVWMCIIVSHRSQCSGAADNSSVLVLPHALDPWPVRKCFRHSHNESYTTLILSLFRTCNCKLSIICPRVGSAQKKLMTSPSLAGKSLFATEIFRRAEMAALSCFFAALISSSDSKCLVLVIFSTTKDAQANI